MGARESGRRELGFHDPINAHLLPACCADPRGPPKGEE